eukprot:SM000155S01637  [mRNA]  locus=s155:42573:48141:+ [translate_table: standard]
MASEASSCRGLGLPQLLPTAPASTGNRAGAALQALGRLDEAAEACREGLAEALRHGADLEDLLRFEAAAAGSLGEAARKEAAAAAAAAVQLNGALDHTSMAALPTLAVDLPPVAPRLVEAAPDVASATEVFQLAVSAGEGELQHNGFAEAEVASDALADLCVMSTTLSIDLRAGQRHLSWSPLLRALNACCASRPGGTSGVSNDGASGGGGSSGEGHSVSVVQLSVGIMQVNAGQHAEAAATFSQILRSEPRNVAALIGRGTAHALQRKLHAAISDFTAALKVEPKAAEAWKRRAQARAALGASQEVVDDFTRAQALEPASPDVLQERGLVLCKLKDFHGSIQDLCACTAIDPSNKAAFNFLGLALSAAGRCEDAIAAFDKAVKLDPTFKEAWVNMGQSYKDRGIAPKATECFQKAIKLDPSYSLAHRLFGLFLHGLGKHREAVKHLEQALAVEPQHVECHYLRAACHHATGLLGDAVKEYDAILGLEPEGEGAMYLFLAFYQREVALYTARHLQEPLHCFNIDNDLDANFKLAWCKKMPPTLLFPDYVPQPVSLEALSRRSRSRVDARLEKQRAAMLEFADRLGRRMQYTCPGFLKNARQHRMAGLAAINIAQAVRSSWKGMVETSRDDKDGVSEVLSQGSSASGVPGSRATSTRKVGRRKLASASVENGDLAEDATCSTSNRGGVASSSSSSESGYGFDSKQQGTVDTWRSMYSIAVRWRQLAEPCDPVVWVDQLSPREFVAGFGSHTPIQLGHSRVLRYYPNFTRAFKLMKTQILERGYVFNAANERVSLAEGSQRQQVEAALDCSDLYKVVGGDFYVVTPCQSLADPTQTPLNTVDFFIRTPGTPARWARYDAEMSCAWKELCHVICHEDDKLAAPRAIDKLSHCILRLSYYWYNFMPLVRGTAAVGYITLLGLYLAAGLEVTTLIPPGVQVDWDAILSPRLETFLGAVRPWLESSLKECEHFHALPPLQEVFPTIASILAALSFS